MNKTPVIGYTSALLAAILFGAVPTIAKPVISNINVLLLSSIAYLIAALVFTPISKKAKMVLSKRDHITLVAISVCGAAAAPYLYFLGLHQSSASDTSLLSNVEIMFTVLFGLLFFREITTSRFCVSITCLSRRSDHNYRSQIFRIHLAIKCRTFFCSRIYDIVGSRQQPQ